MNKIKVIDLLNMISKGEEVPRKIKIKNVIYEYIGYMYCTEKANYQDIEDYLFGKWNFNILNEEVEIIEEPKKINKIRIDHNSINIDKAFETGTTTFFREKDIEIFQCLSSKINELIDEINNLKEKQ